ncbi:hypothetical protein D3C77_724210 [compost metagenome]
MTPAVFRDQLLQGFAEIVGVVERALYIVLAQHLGADLEAFLIRLVAHGSAPKKGGPQLGGGARPLEGSQASGGRAPSLPL